MKRKRFYQVVFIIAGVYNLLWGACSGLDPQWLFKFSGMPLLNHPSIFACLGMVVGVYGVLYLEVARRPEHGFLLAAIGLLGKVLGPIGWVYMYLSGQWTLKSVVLILTNDLIWWIPFGMYLWDSKGDFLATFRDQDRSRRPCRK